MLNQNAIIIIDVNGNVLREPIGSFRANSNYTSSITVIAPFELDSVVSANYSKKNRRNDDIAQFLRPNGNKKGKDIIGENDPLYQLIHEWHVFEADVDQLAVAYFAKYRSDMLFVSIGVGNIVKPAKAITYKGEFGIDSLLPEVADYGDYYISKNYNFMDKNIQWTLNDYAYYDNGWKKSNYRGEAFTEPIELLVDPAIEANYEIQEDLDLSVLLAGRLATLESRVNVISDQVDNQQDELDNHETRIETLETNVQTNINDINDLDTRITKNTQDIDDIKLKDINQDNILEIIESDIRDIEGLVKIDEETITRNSSSEMQVNPLLVEKINDNSTNLIGVVNDVIYQGSTHIMTFKRNEMPDIVIDLPIEALISNVSLDGDDLVFTFESGDIVRVPLNTLLVGVVKQVNGVYADSNGMVNLTIDDIPNLRTSLNSKLDITTYTNDRNEMNTLLNNKVEISKQVPKTPDMIGRVGVDNDGSLWYAPYIDAIIKVREMNSLDSMVSYEGTLQPNLTQVIDGDFVKYSNDFDYVFPFNEMEEVVDELGNSFIKIPPIWFKFYQDIDGNLKGYDMASKKIDNDYVLFPVHQKGDLFVGKYQAHRVGNDLRSVKDVEPTMSLNIANYRDFAKNVGSKYFANDWQVWGIVRFLMTAYFGTTNSDNYFPDINGGKANTGTMDDFKNAYNSVSGKNTFFGIENILKNGFHFIDGVINNNAEVWFNDKHETYSNTLNADYLLKGLKPTVEGYIQQYKSGLHTLPLINTGASSTTYYADYLYYQSDFRVLLSGSGWASGARDGVWRWGSGDVFAGVDSFIGSRLNKTS